MNEAARQETADHAGTCGVRSPAHSGAPTGAVREDCGAAISTARADDIKTLDAAKWNAAIGPDALHLRHEHLRAVQQAGLEVACYRFLLFERAGGVCGAAVLYCIDTPLSVFWPRRLDAERLVAASRAGGAKRPARFAVRTIECGLPTAVGQAVAIRDTADAEAIWTGLFSEMWRFADEMGCKSLMVRDLSPESAATARSFAVSPSPHPRGRGSAGNGAQVVPFLPNARLAIAWESWEAYVASLRKRYRQRIRQHEAAFARAGIVREHRQDFAHLAGELFALYAQVYARATELRREQLTPDFFAAMDRELGERSSVMLYRQSGRLVGFDLLFHDDATLRCLYTGFDYRVNKEAHLYFNLYYDDVRTAIDRRMKRIEWGLGAYPAKLMLGAQPAPLQVLLLHRSPLVARVLKTVFTCTQGRRALPAYRVFREEAARR